MTEEKKKSAPAPAAQASEPAKPTESAQPHHPKISRMTLPQVEKALDSAKQHMGGLQSAYGSALRGRQAILRQNKKS